MKLHHVLTYPTTSSLSTGSNLMLTSLLHQSNEHQPLLGTLKTRLDDESDESLQQVDNDVESDFDQFIAWKIRRIGGGIV